MGQGYPTILSALIKPALDLVACHSRQATHRQAKAYRGYKVSFKKQEAWESIVGERVVMERRLFPEVLAMAYIDGRSRPWRSLLPT